VSADQRWAENPPAQSLRYAEFVIAVARVAEVVHRGMTNVPVDSPASAHVVGGAKIQVVRPLGVRRLKVVAKCVRPLQSDPLPAAGKVTLGVVHRAAVCLAVTCTQQPSVAPRVVVVQKPCVYAEVPERFLVAAVEIHFQV